MPVWLRNWAPFVLLASGLFFFDWLRERRRKEALIEVAQRLGLRFEAKDWALREFAPQLESRHFANGSFRNSLSGELAGFKASFFDHSVGGKGGHTDTIASFTQEIFLPEFALAQQNTFNKIVDAVIHRQIDFPSDPAFSKRFRLVGTNESRVADLFATDMREFVSGIDPTWRIEASGHTLFIYRLAKTVKPEVFADFVSETTEMAKRFFNHCHLREPVF